MNKNDWIVLRDKKLEMLKELKADRNERLLRTLEREALYQIYKEKDE